MYRIVLLLPLFFFCCGSCKEAEKIQPKVDRSSAPEPGYRGLHGYVGYWVSENPAGFGSGVSFYTAAWRLVNKPLTGFQIGLPGTWIIPDNRDNTTLALCPPGTLASNWSERGPTYQDVFQTLEGGLGYWAGNKYRYGPPKYSMNATPQCYDYEVASPGWSFFYDDEALPDNRLGIAQLSNSLLIPPDGITFDGDPNGAFMGYSYMALPFTEAYVANGVSTGDQSWTCFVNTENFKGPIAYYLPETWSKLSQVYPAIDGRGLDSRPGIANGGAMEINTVPHYIARDSSGIGYVRIPGLNFPVDESGKAVLVQDLKFYNKIGLYDAIKNWRDNDVPSSGAFKSEGMFSPELIAFEPNLKQTELEIQGVSDVFTTFVSGSTFGIQWESNDFANGKFPEYFKRLGNTMVPVTKEEVPVETKLSSVQFATESVRPAYTSPTGGIWSEPGPVSGPFTTILNDGSTVTYYWYRFIDQPVFRQFDWSAEKRDKLQLLVEKIHSTWTTTEDFIPPPTTGSLISLDSHLLVTPPEGLEFGYVPIVVKQQR